MVLSYRSLVTLGILSPGKNDILLIPWIYIAVFFQRVQRYSLVLKEMVFDIISEEDVIPQETTIYL